MSPFLLLVGLVALAVLVIWAAARLAVPYPVALVIAGSLLGFVPGMPALNFNPSLLLLIVLPPILFAAAYDTSWRDFRKQLRAITLLAVGLVVATTLVIGAALRWLFPDIPWAVAFAFGAIVSPPDAVAATAVFSRLRAPRLMTVTLQGESLLNDATGLILYKFAVAAALTGAFSMTEAMLDFVWVAAAGLALGWGAGWLLQWLSVRIGDPELQIVFSFVIPYLIYSAAEAFHASGVLAVVAAGLVGSRWLTLHYSAQARILGWSTWEVVTLLLDALVFTLIGSQLYRIVTSIESASLAQMLGYGALLAVVATVVRIVWMFPGAYLPRKFDAAVLGKKVTYPPWQHVLVAGWCGMRGIVSLVAALALPLTLPGGAAFPYRDEVIFLTFVVVFLTLVVPGLTLAPLMRALKMGRDADAPEEMRHAREESARAALKRIDHLLQEGRLAGYAAAHLRREYESRLHMARPGDGSSHNAGEQLTHGRMAALQAQRARLLELLRQGRISEDTLHELEHELDYEEARLAAPE